ncbi:MAG: hypothetical protein ACJASR_000117 [Psychroserpens sp.]|jgi:hypothetical protein
MYVLGLPRSGTTILSEYLNFHFKGFNLGEWQSLTTRSYSKNGKCQCGEQFHECEFWSEILEDLDGNQIKELKWLRANANKLAFKKMLGLKNIRATNAISLMRNIANKAKIYSNSSMAIDSSKNPLWVYLTFDKAFDTLIYINRNPVYCLCSYLKQGISYPITRLFNLRCLSLIPRLLLKNRTIQCSLRSFTSSPTTVLKQINSKFFSNTFQFDSSNSNGFKRQKAHSIAGNPHRLEKGFIEIDTIMDSSPCQQMSKSTYLMLTMFNKIIS